MDQAPGVRLLQRLAGLAEQVNGALRGHRAEPLDQRLQIEPVQQLHDEEEGSVVGHPEIVQTDGVRGAERRGRLGLAAEALGDHPGGAGELEPRISDRISFTAAGRASIWCVARNTSPIPPLPSCSSSR